MSTERVTKVTSHALVTIMAIACLLAPAFASPNGKCYICDASVLSSSSGLCKFAKSTSTEAPCSETYFSSVGPNNETVSGFSSYNFQVVTYNGTLLPPSPKPLTNGDTFASSSSALTGSNWLWVLATQINFKLRNVLMFEPEKVAGNVTAWNELVKPWVDCHVKDHQESVEENGRTIIGYRLADIYTILSNPKGNSVMTGQPTGSGNINNQVLQFLEEGSVDLTCLMVNSDAATLVPGMSRCVTIRNAWGLSDTQYSDCWVAGYTSLFGSAPATSGASVTLTSSTYNSTTPAPTPAPTSASPAAAARPLAAALYVALSLLLGMLFINSN